MEQPELSSESLLNQWKLQARQGRERCFELTNPTSESNGYIWLSECDAETGLNQVRGEAKGKHFSSVFAAAVQEFRLNNATVAGQQVRKAFEHLNTEPQPVANHHTAVWDLVLQDLQDTEDVLLFDHQEATVIRLRRNGDLLAMTYEAALRSVFNLKRLLSGRGWTGIIPETVTFTFERSIVSSVLLDVKQRDLDGFAKYGVRLQPHNKRNPLVDAYQEAMDLAVYLRQALYERDGK